MAQVVGPIRLGLQQWGELYRFTELGSRDLDALGRRRCQVIVASTLEPAQQHHESSFRRDLAGIATTSALDWRKNHLDHGVQPSCCRE